MTTKKSGCGCLSIITIFTTLLIAGGYSLNTSESETVVNSITSEIEQNFSQADLDINYQEDISPWLGNMAIASNRAPVFPESPH